MKSPNALTPRQKQVYQRVARGKSYPEVGASLGIGVRTVETHVAGIMEALKLDGRPQFAIVRHHHERVLAARS